MSSAPKFVFECLGEGCPDRKCCSRDSVMVYYEDLRRWLTDQTMNIVFPNLEYTIQGGFPVIILKKYENEKLCAMFNKETNNCNIYYSKPISCSTYPLGFNGNAFFVMNKECAGLGKGTMTPESLKEMRKQAKLDYECRTRTTSTLPLVNELYMRFFMKAQEQFMEEMSEEDKQKLVEQFLKEKGAKPSDEDKQEPGDSEVNSEES